MNDLAIIRKENIDLIVSSAPSAYQENMVSHDRCIEAGKALLQRITDEGMTDELDQQVALFLGRARKTVRKMNDKRAPLTKLFDEIRTTFTGMENDIDATKSNTIPALLQAERNKFAAKKHEEELARQREAMRLLQEKQYRDDFFKKCQDSYRDAFNSKLNTDLNYIHALFQTTTLENYAQRLSDIKAAVVELHGSFISDAIAAVTLHPNIPADESRRIRLDAMQPLMEEYKRQYHDQMSSCRDNCLSLMPSKQQELKRAEQASAEEAERIRKEMAEKDAAEAAKMNEERLQHEQQQRMEADMKSKQSEVGNLFDQAQVAAPIYQPKTSVKKTLVPIDVNAFPEIISMWWTKEGCKLSIDELSKMFKKQITFCEKCAKDGEFIQSEHIEYKDEVKAK